MKPSTDTPLTLLSLFTRWNPLQPRLWPPCGCRGDCTRRLEVPLAYCPSRAQWRPSAALWCHLDPHWYLSRKRPTRNNPWGIGQASWVATFPGARGREWLWASRSWVASALWAGSESCWRTYGLPCATYSIQGLITVFSTPMKLAELTLKSSWRKYCGNTWLSLLTTPRIITDEGNLMGKLVCECFFHLAMDAKWLPDVSSSCLTLKTKDLATFGVRRKTWPRENISGSLWWAWMATSMACHFTSCVKMNCSMLISITRLTGNCLKLGILETTCDLHVLLFIYTPLNNCSQIPAAPCISRCHPYSVCVGGGGAPPRRA